MATNTRRSSAHSSLAVVLLASLALGACAVEQPQSTVSPGLETGIRSSNGGGARALGNVPNVGVTTQTAPTRY